MEALIILVFIPMFILLFFLSFEYYLFQTIKKRNTAWKHVEEESYNNYSEFYGEDVKNDVVFQEKVKKIYNLIVKEKCDDIKLIAKESDCKYNECIIKIDYLKHNNLISQDYYIDHINGYIKKCEKKDMDLIKKYSAFIYKQKLQIKDIAVKMPQTTNRNMEEAFETVRKDIKYLIEKDLIEGVIYNEIDDVLIYYEDNKMGKDLISMKCPNCGATVELQRGGKVRCDYCNCIIKSEEAKIISKEK